MIDRRSIIAAGALAAFAGRGGEAAAGPLATQGDDTTKVALHGRSIRIADLTHRLTRAFAFTPGRLSLEHVEGSGTKAGMRLNRLCIVEHTGTHLDAPSHFDPNGKSVGDLAIGDLVVPLAVIDIRGKVAKDRDARVEADDILKWERAHGTLPDGCCVAMLSGWNPLAEMARYPELAPSERQKSPGFADAVAPLLIARNARGIAVDTLSLDPGGAMPAYPFHRAWLRSGRWGLEALANLARVPASGTLLFVGAPPVADATGVPVRAIAMF